MSDAGKLATQRANMIYEAGRMPFTGIDVVAINPAEQAAMEQANMAASAFGMPTGTADPFSGMEVIESGGLRGYSSYPIYIADMQRLKEQRPDQYAALARQSGFDPITGEALAPPTPVYTNYGGGSSGDGGGGSTADAIALHHAIHGTGGGYSNDGSTLNYSSTGSAPTVRPMMSPNNRGGVLGFEDKVRLGVSSAINNSPIGKIFGALTNQA